MKGSLRAGRFSTNLIFLLSLWIFCAVRSIKFFAARSSSFVIFTKKYLKTKIKVFLF